MTLEVVSICLAYCGRRASIRRSIIGMLINKKSSVIETGPTIVHQYRGAAARANRYRPHQNVISPK
jgi:hypothetical protein